jgi:hypothetical protein
MRILLIAVAALLMAFAPPAPENIYPNDWRPTDLQRTAVTTTAQRYFDLADAGDDAGAFAAWVPGATVVSFEEYAAGNQLQRREGGKVLGRQIHRVTWYKDPAGAPAGLYVALDFVGRYQKADIYCGYLLLTEVKPGVFQVMRLESSFLENGALAEMRKQTNYDALWTQLMQSCPVGPVKPAAG